MAVTSDTHQLCAELRAALSRHGVELPALMPLAELNISPAEEPDVPVIWLGCCRTPTAQRLLELAREVPPSPSPRDLRAAVREANAQSARSARIQLIKGGQP
jgi:hypothetical protein